MNFLSHRLNWGSVLGLMLGVAFAAVCVTAHAQSQPQSQPSGAGHSHADHAGHAGHSAAATPASVPMSDAEVRRIDRDAGKVTLRHGPIPNLDMPPMTMVFVAKDKAMLEGLKAGDKVRFRAVEQQGAYIVTTIEPVR
jgi:Cu/Ag efflux protein CusF